ncbi:TIGR02594, TIGR02594 family protein [uncultured Caudovirales phage]|uniref:TIGR02594, TIGR02594 family protein n=1 Tax=uncultured Caudovirales phage TaxID=2100421 RepID=A0A6J7WU96_9CAUD|nr:TIGR02594, TIGR02594 family protein [uncultured Caudovirales phage]
MNDLSWMAVAKSYLGTREGPGAANNPVVVELFKLAGHPEVKDDETAWCAAFVGGVLAKAGLSGSRLLNARSYETWGQALPQNVPVYGCVGVKKRAGGQAWQGHVGFVVGASASQIILLGGNQGDSVSVAAFPRADFTAFRYPSKIALPKTAYPLPGSVAGALRSSSEA